MASIAVTRRPNAVALVTLEGEFDVSNAPDVVTALDEAIADDESRTVAVDLSKVGFLDSTMLQTLISARDRAQLARKPVWLVRPEPLIWRVFTVTLIRELFRDFGTLEELEAYAAASIKTLQDPAAPKASAGS
jgi:anti-sigma B factor antagonist